MKTNVTLKLDAALLREAKILAAQEGISLSRLMAELLEARVRSDRTYERARQYALARIASGYSLQWTPPASRDELHER